jgi:hypothetical protein
VTGTANGRIVVVPAGLSVVVNIRGSLLRVDGSCTLCTAAVLVIG